MLNFNIMGALTNFHHLQKGQFLCKSLKFVNETNKSAIFYQKFLQNYLVLRVYLLLLWMVHKVVGFVLFFLFLVLFIFSIVPHLLVADTVKKQNQ